MTSLVTEKAIKKNVWQMPESSKYLQRNLVLDNGHLLVQVLKRSGILGKRIVHKELGIISRDETLLEFRRKRTSYFRANDSIVQGYTQEQKDMENCQYTSLQIIQQLQLFFAQLFPPISSVFTEQLRTYVRNLKPIKIDRGNPMGQSIVLSEIKAEVPLQNENPPHHQILWQQYEERIKSLSQESKVSKFCMEAGFVHVVEVGQYFMTKDTGDFRQFRAGAFLEYTFPRDDESSQPRGWIQGNTRIGPVLEVTTSFMYGKHGIEIRIWSVSQDSSHSWVRISYGTNKYVVDSNYNNTEVPADLPEEQASQSSVKVIAARSKAKAKPQKRETVELPSTIPMNERKWIVEPAKPSLSLRTRSRRK